MSPFNSDDLTNVIRQRDGDFLVLRSPDTAEDAPSYKEIASFKFRNHAEEFVEHITRLPVPRQRVHAALEILIARAQWRGPWPSEHRFRR